MKHVPVMAKEVIELAAPQKNENVVDGTLGAGGHASLFLNETGPMGRLLGLEVDETASKMASDTLEKFSSRFKIVQKNFRELDNVLENEKDFVPHVDIVFLDLGLSSMLIDQPHKGLSFQQDGPLDMRMEAREGSFHPMNLRSRNNTLQELRRLRGNELTAYDLVNFLSQNDLSEMLYQYDVRDARKIAKYIAINREKQKIYTTFDLLQAAFRGPRRGKRHPATTTFQALRMVVNREVESLEATLKAAWKHLAPNGRIVVLSYHSIEDRTVKIFFKQFEGTILTKKPLTPSWEEIKTNPRSRSAKLRAIQKSI
jgi:16S rRNA (cytosine1402-N4)-methyltransferase